MRLLITLAICAALAGCAHGRKCDIDGDGDRFDEADFEAFRAAFGTERGSEGYNPKADMNRDGLVAGDDFEAYIAECDRG